MSEDLPSRGDHVTVENLDGDRSRAVVVGIAEKTAGEYVIPSNNGERPLTEYWFGHDIDEDEPVVEIRYVNGVDLEGTPSSYSPTVYGHPISAVHEGGER